MRQWGPDLISTQVRGASSSSRGRRTPRRRRSAPRCCQTTPSPWCQVRRCWVATRAVTFVSSKVAGGDVAEISIDGFRLGPRVRAGLHALKGGGP